MKPKRYLTGLTPSSNQLHIGNYFGAIKPMLDLQAADPSAEFFLFLSNMHALTKEGWDGALIKNNSMHLLKLYMACGCTPDKFMIYKQSDIPAHAQLCRVFSCMTHMGFMERMHAYKDAVAKGKGSELSVGTFIYPILMAVDILLYDVNIVPVGKDQKQHVEFAKDIAQKFNHQFGETFVLPEPYIQPTVATIVGTDGRKMSKSYNNYIGLLDLPEDIQKKVARIPTSALPIESPKDPETCTLFAIYKLFLDPAEEEQLRGRYRAGGLSYKQIKQELTEHINTFLAPIQEAFYRLDDDQVHAMLEASAQHLLPETQKKQAEVYEKVGFMLE